MSKKYKNPPIVEAIFEIKLSDDTNWDPTVPGLMYEKLKDEFPTLGKALAQEVKLNQDKDKLKNINIVPIERTLFFAENKKSFVQLAPRLLTVNVLKPYPGWESFQRLIKLAWNRLKDVVNINGIKYVKLRYINNIELSNCGVELKDYFVFYPFVGESFPQQINSFVVGIQFKYAEDRDVCRAFLTKNKCLQNENKVQFTLDLRYFTTKSNEIDSSKVLEWVEEAHLNIGDVFEACITDKLRSTFKEDE